MALRGRVPLIPAALIGTSELMPYDRKIPKGGRAEVRFGKPLRFARHCDTPADRFVLRSVTDEIMYEIMLLSGQEYVDEYASKIKEQLTQQARGEEAAKEPEPIPVQPSERAGAAR